MAKALVRAVAEGAFEPLRNCVIAVLFTREMTKRARGRYVHCALFRL